MNLRILLADDHEVVRHGVRGLLAGHPGWEVCGEATDGRDAVNKALELKPDVVVLDISMPNLNGLEATRLITQALPQTRILILTMHESEQLVREVLESGARGFLLKSDASHELVAAIEALQRHKTFFKEVRAKFSRREKGKSSRCLRKAEARRKWLPRWVLA